MTKISVKKYKVFNITENELKAILEGRDQISACAECSDEEYAIWAKTQMKLINSFYKKVKIQS